MAIKSKYQFHPDRVRLPQPDELDRVAFVAAAGFYRSPVSAYERPHRDSFPRDTVLSYQQELLKYLSKPECVLTTLDDEFEKSEDDELYPALEAEYGGKQWAKQGGRLIVGFACLTLKSGSARVGKFQPEGEPPKVPDDGDIPSRDQSKEGIEKLFKTVGPPMEKYLDGQFCVDMIAVHPKYWRRGHGTSLLMWAARLADEDQVSLGIASVPMGINISRSVGFQEEQIVEVEGYPEHPENLSIWIGLRVPGQLPSLPRMEPPEGWGFAWVYSSVRNLFWRRDGLPVNT